MSEDLEWWNSKCIGTFLHDFRIYQAHEQGVHEVCRRCGESAYFPIVNGQTDNLDYLSYHLRSALPRYHPLFLAEYPNAKLQK